MIEIRIEKLEDLTMLSQAYLKGEIKVNISALAKELNSDRSTVRRYLNGFVPSKMLL